MRPLLLPGAFALATLLLHLLTNGSYGYFRDELYFLAGGDHLDWGYVDHAPLIAVYAKLGRVLFGDSLHGIRFLVGLAEACSVFLTGLIARELGGQRFAVALACLGVMLTPVNLLLGTLLGMNAFEPLFWMGCAYVLLLAIRRDNPKLLLWFGVLAGLGLENKHSMLFFGAAMVIALLLSHERRLLWNRWMWIAGAIALALFLPNLIWQIQHGWPTIEDLNNVRRTHKNVELGPVDFIIRQVMMVSPVNLLVWVAGLWYLMFDREGKRFRVLGWSFLAVFAMMLVMKGKDYYLAPAYPMLFAAGGVFWERVLKPVWLKAALPAVMLAGGAFAAPIVLPILPPDQLVSYMEATGLTPPRSERSHSGPLPQHFGDMFGWEEMVAATAKVYHALPPEERAKAGIYAENYGQAGAIDFFGPRYGLPKAICAHQTYFYWGPRQYTGEVLILLGVSRQSAERHFASVEDTPPVGTQWSMGFEHYTIRVGRGLNQPLATLWPKLKHWN